MGEYIEYLRRHKEVKRPRKVEMAEKVVVKVINVQGGEGILFPCLMRVIVEKQMLNESSDISAGETCFGEECISLTTTSRHFLHASDFFGTSPGTSLHQILT